MKSKIKELRVSIDGLSQLVKGLNPRVMVVDLAMIPKRQTAEDFMNMIKNHQTCFVNKSIDNSPVIQEIVAHEIEKAYDSLILGKAWLGKMLGELGEETPYKNDGDRTTVADIEPTSNKALNYAPIDTTVYCELSNISKIDMLREEIGKYISEVKVLDRNVPRIDNREVAIARTNAYNCLCEARMWLGFELSRIRDTNKTV